MKPRKFVMKVLDRLPIFLQKTVFKTTVEARFLILGTKWALRSHKNIPDPARVYWISPERIKYHTNYLKDRNAKDLPFQDRTFDLKERGKVIDGDWDITNYKFTDLDVYDAFKKTKVDGCKWQDTMFYKKVIRQVESGKVVWGCKNDEDLNERCKYYDSLFERIRDEGYRLNRGNYDRSMAFDEISVNIGRNGEHLFQDGVHRLSIAKILGVKRVPVMVFVRHKKWQEFREFVISYAQEQPGRRLYQPIIHPDLDDIPYNVDEECQDRMEAIASHLGKKSGIMLDVGANLGFFCHKFEDLGYQCYAIEADPSTFRILEKIKIAENKKFIVINKSIFETEFIKNMEFDVVLALNIFHHFLKSKTEFSQLKDLLRNLKTNELFFEPHLYHEDQMKDAYVNYGETEFVEFLLRHTSLRKSQLIYTGQSGRHVFKLSK